MIPYNPLFPSVSQLYQPLIKKMQTEQQIPKKIGRYLITRKIGQGSFGCIFSGQHEDETESREQQNNSNEVAIKTELITNVKQMLLLEFQMYRLFQGCRGFPRVFEYVEEERYSFLVIEKFEMSLDKYAASKFPKQFVPADTLLQIMSQTLRIVKQIHEKGYLYRDLKPANFMVKAPYQQIFIIDFGLCKKYIQNGRHIGYRENKRLVGTPLFCSVNTHAGLQQSRRDDIESWLWTCLFFSLQLPWQSCISRKQLTKQQQVLQIQKQKRNTNWPSLLKSHNRTSPTKIPACILKIVEYMGKMEFQERPKYQYLEKLIAEEYEGMGRGVMGEFQINWEGKTPLTDITGKEGMREKNQEDRDQNQSPRKVKKINFKAPIKNKAIQSEHPREQSQAPHKNPISNSN